MCEEADLSLERSLVLDRLHATFGEHPYQLVDVVVVAVVEAVVSASLSFLCAHSRKPIRLSG